MNSSTRKIAVGTVLAVGGLFAAYAVYDFWRLSVPPLPTRDRKKNPKKSSAVLTPAAAEQIPDPDVDVASTAKGARKNAESRRIVAQGMPRLSGVTWPAFARFNLGQAPAITLNDLFTPISNASEKEFFLSVLPERAKAYGADILRASMETGVSPYLLAAIANAETGYGESRACGGKGPACKSGNYLGLTQFGKKEAGWALEKLPNGRPKWSVPYFNFRRAAEYLIETRDLFLRLLKNAKVDADAQDQGLLAQWVVAAYNKGAGTARKGFLKGKTPDSVTHISEDFDTGVSLPYVTRVYNHMNALRTYVPAVGV